MSATIIRLPTTTAEEAGFVSYGTSTGDRDDVSIVLRRCESGGYDLTRFVGGHWDGSFRFDQRHEAYEAARICNRLAHIDIIDEGGPPEDWEMPY